MASVKIDPSGVLVVDGAKTFPICVSNAPYYDPRRSNPPAVPNELTTPEGTDALAELASAGVNVIRIGMQGWSAAEFELQVTNQQQWLEAAERRRLLCWSWLGDLPNLPAAAGSPTEQLLRRVVQGIRPYKALASYKGIDEPANFFRPKRIPVAGMKRAYDVLRKVDPDHPVVVIHSPRSVGNLAAYSTALDITGADIYPVAYPPGEHLRGTPNEDIGIVGDVTQTMVQAAKGKPVWMTLQIAWSGVTNAGKVLRFPTFAQQRFMAYQAIARGARGLTFFGGHVTEVGTPPDVRPICTQTDIQHGWNWRFWRRVLRPLVEELSAQSDLHPALVAPNSKRPVTCRLVEAGKVTARAPRFLDFTVREAAGALYLIAARRGSPTIQVQFRFPGINLAPTGRVLFEPPRTVAVRRASGASSFTDWFAPYDVHVYELELAN
jgi:hypothetical protein